MIMQCDLNLKGKNISLFHMYVHICLYVCMLLLGESAEVTLIFGVLFECISYIAKTNKSIIFMSSNMVNH